jgi:glycosyltransferase involved in cell wall biosynthesis
LQTSTNQKWQTTENPELSVVILGFRRADLLERAISSFCRHNSLSAYELVLVLNGAAPAVRELAWKLLAENQIPLLVVDGGSWRPGAARNHGVAQARAPSVLFLDDDIECFQDMGRATIEIFRDPGVVVAGGANLTPPESGPLERAAGYVLSSWLGAASMRKRYRIMPAGSSGEHSLILCNLAVRREAFFAERGFALHLISNEENVLLQQLERRGARLLHSPKLAVFHKRRDSWGGTFEQAVKYGSGRAQNLLLVPHSIRPLYFLPAAFLLYLAALPFSSSFLGFVPVFTYGSLAIFYSLATALVKRDRAALLMLLVFPFVHLAYGFGFLKTLLSWGFRRKQLLEHAF